MGEDNIDVPRLVVLEVRYYAHCYYTVGHIPGARQVQRFKDLGNTFSLPIVTGDKPYDANFEL
ncbi:MAG: hypothetical protein ACNA75_07790 [Thiohalomonadaceae bacterium]